MSLFHEIEERMNEVSESRFRLHKSASAFLLETASNIRKMLPQVLDIDPVFVNFGKIEDMRGDSSEVIRISMPLGTMIRFALDGEENRKTAEWSRLAREAGYNDLNSDSAMAFFAGLDDRRVAYRDESKNIEYSCLICPRWSDDYHRGRETKIDYEKAGIGRFSRANSRQNEWLALCLEIDTDLSEINLKMSISSDPCPDPEDDWRWKNLDIEEDPSLMAESIIDGIMNAKEKQTMRP